MSYKKKKKKTSTSKPKKKRVVSDATKKKMSESMSKVIAEGTNVPSDKTKITRTRFSTKMWYHSTKNNEDFYADSLAERLQMQNLDMNSNVKRWTKRHGIRIPYVYRGKSKNTVPDFLVEFEDGQFCIQEVKGKITDKELAKKEATENYCKRMGYLYNFITTKDLDINGEYTSYLKFFKKPKRKKRKFI